MAKLQNHVYNPLRFNAKHERYYYDHRNIFEDYEYYVYFLYVRNDQVQSCLDAYTQGAVQAFQSNNRVNQETCSIKLFSLNDIVSKSRDSTNVSMYTRKPLKIYHVVYNHVLWHVIKELAKRYPTITNSVTNYQEHTYIDTKQDGDKNPSCIKPTSDDNAIDVDLALYTSLKKLQHVQLATHGSVPAQRWSHRPDLDSLPSWHKKTSM